MGMFFMRGYIKQRGCHQLSLLPIYFVLDFMFCWSFCCLRKPERYANDDNHLIESNLILLQYSYGGRDALNFKDKITNWMNEANSESFEKQSKNLGIFRRMTYSFVSDSSTLDR